MIRIKKLSTKLLLGLGAILLCFIVFQVIVTKRVANDLEIIRQLAHNNQAHQQALTLLRNGELKTYNRSIVSPFSSIRIIGVETFILKGDEFAVYASDYYRNALEVKMENDELFIGFTENVFNNRDLPVFITMPEDPQMITFDRCRDMGTTLSNTQHSIIGFRGENTHIFSNSMPLIRLVTDMPYINVTHYAAWGLDIKSLGSDVQLSVEAEHGAFSFDDQFSNSLNATVQLRESTFVNMHIHQASSVGTLSVSGTLHDGWMHSNGNNDRERISIIAHSSQVDSLVIQLSSNQDALLRLSTELSGRYESIDVSGNLRIARDIPR